MAIVISTFTLHLRLFNALRSCRALLVSWESSCKFHTVWNKNVPIDDKKRDHSRSDNCVDVVIILRAHSDREAGFHCPRQFWEGCFLVCNQK